MSTFRLTRSGLRDLDEILTYVEIHDGERRAEALLRDLIEAAKNLTSMPSAGRVREDLTVFPLRFWTVHSFLIVYRPDTAPIEIVRIVHGSRDLGMLATDSDD